MFWSFTHDHIILNNRWFDSAIIWFMYGGPHHQKDQKYTLYCILHFYFVHLVKSLNWLLYVMAKSPAYYFHLTCLQWKRPALLKIVLWPKLCMDQRHEHLGSLWICPVWQWLRVETGAMLSLQRSLLFETNMCWCQKKNWPIMLVEWNILDTSLCESPSIWFGFYLER